MALALASGRGNGAIHAKKRGNGIQPSSMTFRARSREVVREHKLRKLQSALDNAHAQLDGTRAQLKSANEQLAGAQQKITGLEAQNASLNRLLDEAAVLEDGGRSW